jgi:hypothetical protein
MIMPVIDYGELRFEERVYRRPAHKQAGSCDSLSYYSGPL